MVSLQYACSIQPLNCMATDQLIQAADSFGGRAMDGWGGEEGECLLVIDWLLPGP